MPATRSPGICRTNGCLENVFPGASHCRSHLEPCERFDDLGCTEPAVRRGLCRRHYRESLRDRPAGARRTTTPTTPTLTGRRFGVEIEFVGITREGAAQVLRDAGVDAHAEGYGHTVRRHWKIVHDASLMGGGEVVSPVLTGEDGLRQLRDVMTALRGAGARVDSSTGLHVHHDMNGLTGDEIARFVEFYVARQDTFDRLVAESRRDGRNSMCARMRPSELSYWTGMFRAYGRVDASRDDHRRYRTINVCSFPRYGTIEIRQHQGTLSGRKASAWVRLGWSIVAAVQRNTDRQIAHGAAMVGDLVDHANLPTETASFLTARMDALNATGTIDPAAYTAGAR